ncbi:MarP family serine protease [Janibacter cremeus]|uniref:S1-C subfamily serine protease n=1 Tax=Janibacter cremeus TaxID=1285192 RepID=A0A852VWR5_9MICO|nr:MarP family serine protease [Janibacter cremeus]NYF97971.1 S1-C subfamily serine protease [Janibacter cremeus]
MTGALALDIALLLALAAYAVRMYRTGLVAGVFSLIGFLAGGLLALWGLPGVLTRSDLAGGDPLRSGVLLVVGVLIAAALGQAIGAMVGLRVRSWVRFRPARVLDSFLGAVAALLVGATVVWLAASAVVGAFPGAAQPVAGSRVIQVIDQAMPAPADRVLGGVYRALGTDGFPRVFTGVRPEAIRPVEPPPAGVTKGPGLEQAAGSVVLVSGTAPGCGRGQTGSGWVGAPHRVVTNAHVVAGVEQPSVQVGGTGETYPATTVAFDPRRDVAVLAVPDLAAPPLPTGERQSHGDEVVVAGFPLGGPYDLEAGRVRDLITARGAGIDGTPGVDRQVYAVNTRVEHGNSGGPLLSPSGQVVGTVFAKSQTHRDTGYALTLQETRPVLDRAARATDPVSTGSCAA